MARKAVGRRKTTQTYRREFKKFEHQVRKTFVPSKRIGSQAKKRKVGPQQHRPLRRVGLM